MMTNNTNNELTLEQLRARRDKQGLSVADMANRIKVSREIIQYIEQGEFNRIGSATFIRGHLGNYARELQLDPQAVLNLVPAQHLKPYEPKLSSSKVSNPLSRVKTHSSGFGPYVLGTFLVAALGLSVYFVYDKWQSDPADQAIDLVEKQSDTPVKDTPAKKKVIYSSLLPQADMAEQDNKDVAEPSETGQGADNSDMMTEGFDEQTDDEPIEQPAEPLAAQTEQSATEAETNHTTDIQNNAEQALYSIRFDLSEQAWVSIKTEQGDTVVSDLIGPGERLYRADQPVHFRIGNAGQLTLQINDETIDLSDHTRQNVADFNWPPEA